MNFLSAKSRITIGLTCLIVTLMITVSSIGIGPNERRVEVSSRASIAELMAIGCSVHLNRDQRRELNTLLRGLKDRNEQVVSACVKRTTGRVEVAVGDHELNWEKDTKLSETHVVIPLQRGKSEWGSLEILFQPIGKTGYQGFVESRWVQFFVMSGILSYFVVYFFLGHVLKQLDPSNAVPKRVRSALNTLTEGLILTDQKGRMMLSNDAFAAWAGKDAEDLFGVESGKMNWILDDDQDGEINTLRSGQAFPWIVAIQTEAPQAGQLMKLHTAAGENLTLVANSSPILGPNGKYVGALTSFEDITELEEHKAELSLARVAADEANQAKSKFLARMSHEIRTPMNAILGYTEVLQFGMEEDEEKRNKHLATIQSSGEHLLALINDILDLSKIESGRMEMEMTEISIHELVLHVISVLDIKAKEKGIKLSYNPLCKLPEKVNVDGVRLKQAIINLVGNAIKFTSEGGVTVQPEIVERGDETKLLIHIVDTGIGMDANALSKIFEPFAQADTSITRRFGGTGLGLTICRELCEKMGGGIEVVSEVGQGSIFTITIDAGDICGVRRIDKEEFESTCVQVETSKQEASFSGARVLIVDDGEANRELVALFLSRAGVEFDIAVNGKDAVDMIYENAYHVVLMDMHMPVMDGFEATRLLRSRGNTIPIIALTADAMAQDERKCRDAGCSGFLPKPINRERLFASLAEALPKSVVLPATLGPAKVAGNRIIKSAENKHLIESVEQQVLKSVANLMNESESFNELLTEAQDDSEAIKSSLPMDDVDFVNIAAMFVNNLKRKIAVMESSVESSDFKQLYELGHWLKGAGGSAGFDSFNAPGKDLEDVAKSENVEACSQHVSLIRSMFDRIWLPEIQSSS